MCCPGPEVSPPPPTLPLPSDAYDAGFFVAQFVRIGLLPTHCEFIWRVGVLRGLFGVSDGKCSKGTSFTSKHSINLKIRIRLHDPASGLPLAAEASSFNLGFRF